METEISTVTCAYCGADTTPYRFWRAYPLCSECFMDRTAAELNEKLHRYEYAIEGNPGTLYPALPIYKTLEAAREAADQPCMKHDGIPPVRILKRAISTWELA